MSDRTVDTPHGPMPGCPDCGVVVLVGPHLCEHGVTPTPDHEITLTFTMPMARFDGFYKQMMGFSDD